MNDAGIVYWQATINGKPLISFHFISTSTKRTPEYVCLDNLYTMLGYGNNVKRYRQNIMSPQEYRDFLITHQPILDELYAHCIMNGGNINRRKLTMLWRQYLHRIGLL